MAKNAKRHFSEATGKVVLGNTLRKVSRPSADYIKCPVNIGDMLGKESSTRSWKLFKLYVKFLDMKVQNPDMGTFHIYHSHRYYQRTIKALIQKGWAERKGATVVLRAYQFVWRSMGIARVLDGRHLSFKYWKIPVSLFSAERKVYLKEIGDEIRKKISQRKLSQLRYALKELDNTRATFSAKSAGSLFGYKSPDSGSKLRRKYFEVIPQTHEESKPRFNKQRGRFEEKTKEIAL